MSKPSSVNPHVAFSPQWLNALSDAEKQSEDVVNFSRGRHDSGAEHVLWWLWRVRDKNTNTLLKPRQGSMFFVNCGRGSFAVTAGHVYEQFVDDLQTQRVHSCQIGNVRFNSEERLIAWGKHQGIDIATFRVTPEEIAAIGKRVVHGMDGPWPPPPNVGEVVFFGGFPGVERLYLTPEEISFGLHSTMTPITDFSDYQVCCRLERKYWIDVRGLGLPPIGYNLGGVSGGPMLQPTYRGGVWGWRLVGVLSEAVMEQDFERITAVRAHFILPSGRLSP